MTPSNPLPDLKSRYDLACHAMQTGVALKMNYYEKECAPKHLRVGINSAMVETSALAKMLLQKGIMTELEYWTALCEQMESEAASYKQWLETRLGNEITLI